MPKFTKFICLLCYLVFAASLLLLLAGINYCLRNDSGHSGTDPFDGIYFFGAVLGLGVLGLILTSGKHLHPRALVATGVVGIAFSFFVTKLGILNQYDSWIAAGMPERNPHSFLLLIGFAIVGVGGSLVVAYLTTPRAEAPP